MRTKLNLDSSADRIADKMAMSGVQLSGMPLEWLDAGSWRLPSGKALAEFAFEAGFLAPPLFHVEQFGGVDPKSGLRRFLDVGVPTSRVRRCGKGNGA